MSLQKSVDSAESTWREKLLQEEEQVRQLTVDKKNLTLQVSELQFSLEKVKQAEEVRDFWGFIFFFMYTRSRTHTRKLTSLSVLTLVLVGTFFGCSHCFLLKQ